MLPKTTKRFEIDTSKWYKFISAPLLDISEQFSISENSAYILITI